MKYSIIIPVYKVEKYISRCIDSLTNQTKKNDLECIFIYDECENDKSVPIVTEFIDSYNGEISFILIRNKGKGLSGARNTGVNIAKGDYILFYDSDDILSYNCVEKFDDVIRAYPDTQMVQGNTDVEGNSLFQTVMSLENKGFGDYVSDNKWCKHQLLTNGITSTAWNKMLRRDFIISNNLYFEDGILHEDNLWTFYLSKKLSKMAFSYTKTYTYFTTHPSLSNKLNIQLEKMSYSIVLNKIIDDLDVSINKDEYNYLLSLLFSAISLNVFCRKDVLFFIDRISNNSKILERIVFYLFKVLPDFMFPISVFAKVLNKIVKV